MHPSGGGSAKRGPQPRALAPWLLGFLLFHSPPPPSARAGEVEAQLVIPPAETHVIGDPIPLLWKFTNTGTDPVGFMWEGCCRLNGRLEVALDGKPIDLIPPGQALAHMFAKAERIEPGQSREFDTRLSDWVALQRSGTYDLAGRYTGVLPSQQPQVPKGLALWREPAETPPISITVITPAEYLRQRASRERRRGLWLALGGPDELQPITPSIFTLKIGNAAAEAQTLGWPQVFDLWILDPQGRRLPNVSTSLESGFEELTVGPNAQLERRITFSPGRMEGQPFGAYQVFVDLRSGGADQPRVPSATSSFRWELGAREVKDLLITAAAGPATGLRNPALKLLRVHLSEIAQLLSTQRTTELPANARELASELSLAACLKPYAPEPGIVPIRVGVQPDGTCRLMDARLAACAAGQPKDPLAQIAAILAVRRHLGWQPALELDADGAIKVEALFEAARSLAPISRELYVPPHVGFRHPESQVPARLTPRPDLADEQPLVSVERRANSVRVIVATEAGVRASQVMESVEAFEVEVQRQPAPYLRPLVQVSGDLALRDLERILEPLIRRGARVELQLSE